MIAGLFFFLVLAVILDIRTYRIPNALTAAGMAAGLIYHLCRAGPPGMLLALKDLILTIMIFFPVYQIKGLGAGDIKLLSVISMFLGWKRGLVISIYSLFIGAVLGIAKGSILFAIRRKKSKNEKYCNETVQKEVRGNLFSNAKKVTEKTFKNLLKKGGWYLFLRKNLSYGVITKDFNGKQTIVKIQVRNSEDQKCVIHYSIAILAAFLIAGIS